MSVRIVLVGTSHPGNIGSVARAMKTMGLEDLYLVAPERFPAAEATAMAANATDILGRARVCSELREAVDDCGLVVGTTARPRQMAWRMLEPREAAVEIRQAAATGNVALLFGSERSGLTNQEIEQCQLLVTIPTGPQYASLNLAMAVQVLAYEVLIASRSAGAGDEQKVPLATAAEMEKLFEQLEQVLEEIDFRDRTGAGHLMLRLRRLFNRAVLDENEANILRGILTAV
ncbi:MAG TPA: RNA methyltransferase, partial [Steroidobacteraceae bacterium]|nr:RNA methyltransferase [Steroidobacteraceae bacterium]